MLESLPSSFTEAELFNAARPCDNRASGRKNIHVRLNHFPVANGGAQRVFAGSGDCGLYCPASSAEAIQGFAVLCKNSAVQNKQHLGYQCILDCMFIDKVSDVQRSLAEAGMEYPLSLRIISKEESKRLAAEMCARIELPEAYDNRLPENLPGGELQRVAIARILAQGCKIILADESTGNLDSTNTRNIVEILKSLAHDDGCTVIIVTHDPAVAEQADTVLQMKDGSWVF